MRFLIPIIVGACIGYITNWLAIKMLFRPHRKKMLFGITIPFTPGLIPKERTRISKSVGAAVGEHLLSPKIITDALSSDNVNQQVKLWLEKKYNELKEKNESIYEILNVRDLASFNRIKSSLTNSFSEFVINEISKESYKDKIKRFMEENAFVYLKENLIKSLRLNGKVYVSTLLESKESKEILSDFISRKLEELILEDRELKEIISSDSIISIKELLNDNKALLGDVVKQIYYEPDVNKKIKDSIADLAFQNISRVITMFISPEQISEKILLVIEQYINDPKSNDDYLMLMNKSIDNMLICRVSSIMEYVQALINEEDIYNISSRILSNINDETKDKLINNIEIKFIESEEDIKKLLIEGVMNYLVELLKSTELKKNFNKIIDESLNEVLKKPISQNIVFLDRETISTIFEFTKSIFDNFAKNELPKIVEFFDVSKIVENQINSFDVEYTEKLILEIANKELKAITWLGALLGAIMGILTPLLLML